MFYIYFSFTLVVCGGENISLNLTNRQEPEPESEPLEKKSEAGAAWKKKSGAGAAKKSNNNVSFGLAAL